MLRPDAGIIQASGDRVDRCDLSIGILAEVGFHTVEDAQPPRGDGGGGIRRIHAPPGGLAANEPDRGVADEVVEGPDGVGTSAHTGDDGIGELPLLFQKLLLDFPGDDRLKITHYGGEGVGPHHGAQAVVGIADASGPLPHGLGDRILQGGGSGGDRDHLCAQQSHLIDIERLAFCVLLTHKYHTFHPQKRGGGGGGHTVLPRARLGDQPGLPHSLGQKRLSQHIVDLVGSGVVQVLALEIDFGAPQVRRHAFGKVQTGGPPGVFAEQFGEVPVKVRVLPVATVGLLQLNDGIHQRFGQILPAVDAEASF